MPALAFKSSPLLRASQSHVSTSPRCLVGRSHSCCVSPVLDAVPREAGGIVQKLGNLDVAVTTKLDYFRFLSDNDIFSSYGLPEFKNVCLSFWWVSLFCIGGLCGGQQCTPCLGECVIF